MLLNQEHRKLPFCAGYMLQLQVHFYGSMLIQDQVFLHFCISPGIVSYDAELIQERSFSGTSETLALVTPIFKSLKIKLHTAMPNPLFLESSHHRGT